MGRGKKISDVEFNHARKAYLNGSKIADIARLTGRDKTTVKRMVKFDSLKAYRDSYKRAGTQEDVDKQVQIDNLDYLDSLMAKNGPVGSYVDEHFKQEVLLMLAAGFEQLLANRPITIEQVLDYIQENSSKTSEMNTLNKVTWLYTSKFNKRKVDS